MRVSMSRKGNCWDNAVQESFFGTLKQEMAHEKRWANHQEARRDLHEYIEVYYNRQRLHSSLGNRTPAEVDQEHQSRKQGAKHPVESPPGPPQRGLAPGPARFASAC